MILTKLTAWEHSALEEAVKAMVRGNQLHAEQGELLANRLHQAESIRLKYKNDQEG